MRKLFIFLTTAISAAASVITSTGAGGFADVGSTWVGGVAPRDGIDTAVFAGPVVYRVNASPGTAGTAGTTAITCSTGGSFEVQQGVTLTPQGDIQVLNGCAILDAGSTVSIYSSIYRWKAAAAGAYQFFAANGSCTTATTATVSGNKTIYALTDVATGVSPFAADGHIITSSDCLPVTVQGGYLSADDVSQGGGFTGTWLNMYNMASILPACNGPGCNLALTNFYIDSTVGDFSSQYTMNGTINFQNGILANTAGLSFATPANMLMTNVAIINATFGYNSTHGVQGSIANSTLSRIVSLYNWDYPLANGTPTVAPDQVLMVTALPTSSATYNYVNTNVTNIINIVSPNTYNAHIHQVQIAPLATTFVGGLMESMSNLNGGGNRSDGYTMGTGYGLTVENMVLNAEPDGIAAAQLTDLFGTFTTSQLLTDHNTVWGKGPNTGVGIENDSSSTTTNVLTGATNNIFYSPSTGTTNFAVNNCITSNSVKDQVASTAMSNNGRFNMTNTDSLCSGGTNQALSYIGWFTASPTGPGDLTTDPLFLKESSLAQASTPFFSSVYLGVSCPHWSSGTYSQWACVSDSNASYYGGGTINWRCVAASGTGCGTNEPGQSYLGSGTAAPAAYTYWIPDSFYQIYKAVQAGNTITDPTINCVQCSYIQADINWVRSQFAPLDYAHRFGGVGGTTMGAVTTSGCVVRMGSISSAGCAGPF